MRITFEDHARFHRGVLCVTVLASAVACGAALAGADRLSPTVAVLAAAIATLAVALGHVRWVVDPVADALTRAASTADAEGRALLARAGAARQAIGRAARGDGALGGSDRRTLLDASGQAAAALAELAGRRQRLAVRVRGAATSEASAQAEALQRRAEAATDPTARASYGQAVAALRERIQRAENLAAVIDRCDARLAAAVAELEATALSVGTRAELGPGEAPAALIAACDRLRSSGADLGAECDALSDIGAI